MMECVSESIVHHARSRGQLFLVDPGARPAITRMWVGAVDRLGRV